MDFLNKIALVTGGASGIGAEIIKCCLKNKIKNVAIVDINSNSGQSFSNELNKIYGENCTIFIKADVSVYEDLEAAFQKTINTFGNIDIVVNNAGILNEKNYKQTFDINLLGVAHGIQLAFKYLSKTTNNNSSVILNISSLAGIKTLYYCPHYTASKYGVIGLVRSFAEPYYNKNGIRMVTLCPGFTETPVFSTKGIKDDDLEECLDKKVYLNKVQQPDCVGRAAVYVMKNGKHGSIWGIEMAQLFIMNFPDIETFSTVIVKDI